jgi:hypothetical protein
MVIGPSIRLDGVSFKEIMVKSTWFEVYVAGYTEFGPWSLIRGTRLNLGNCSLRTSVGKARFCKKAQRVQGIVRKRVKLRRTEGLLLQRVKTA